MEAARRKIEEYERKDNVERERERGRDRGGKRNESRLRNHERQGSGGEVSGFCGAGATGRGEQGSPGKAYRGRKN